MKLKLLSYTVSMVLLTACGQQDATNTEKSASTPQQATQQTKANDKAQKQLESGIELTNFDTKVKPQDDFYRYVNGAWLDKTEIPADKSSYGSFTALRDKSRQDVKAIIEETAKINNPEPSSDAQKVGDLYRSFMNIEHLNKLGVTPLSKEFNKIDQLKNHDDIAGYFAESQIIGSDAPFGFWINNDSKNPTQYIMYLTQSGLGLPDRDYYLKADEKSDELRQKYQQHIEKMLTLSGIANATAIAKDILSLETALAEIQWSRTENRDAEKTYNKHQIAKLSELSENFNWQKYFATASVDSEKELVIRQPSYLQQFSEIFASTQVSQWKNYFKWTLINANASRLSSEFDQANFEFFNQTLYGTPEQEARWKRAVNAVNRLLGEMVGKIYVKKHFKPEAKQRMIELVENLREAYRQAIIDLDWMGEDTKRQALDKLAKFNPKIGYPDKWIDYSSLTIDVNDLVGNFLRASRFTYQREIGKLGKPIDKSEWFMSPQTVNAYYNPVMNEIVFPAAILQPPFFNMRADDAVNYGGIGSVIGHEMGHGFDDQGSKSDGNGVLRNWWTPKDLEEFKLRTQKLADQYSQFEPLPGEHIKGEFTLGENIGDLGGLTIAFRAYKLSLENKPSPVIDNFTGEQRFFMGWAQVWAYKYRDKALSNMLKTDPHSPGPYRANGPLMNMPEFFETFDVKASDGMYRKPEDRVKIW
ncbi:M13 family metallopeptidase [Aliikangiella maris]|uniref:M13-type metalloendopeptidase n=2 Tax=Aliikangiella maris TaxID=3162458 RepID=A0ABV2BPP0_9GAMM